MASTRKNAPAKTVKKRAAKRGTLQSSRGEAKVARLPSLPKLLERKIYKTGQTRGADDDEIYQNRVVRHSTVLIPFAVWKMYFSPDEWTARFANGFIVLISPTEYFGDPTQLAAQSLALGENALVFYETRTQWNAHNPLALGWKYAESRTKPLGGKYVARIPGTTSNEDGGRIIHGFNTRTNKGAGIRVYEYAPEADIALCRTQLEALFWLCSDSETVAVANGMTKEQAQIRKEATLKLCNARELLDLDRLTKARILNSAQQTVCPLCLEPLSSSGFFSRMGQALGREVLDLTITEINLFHIDELRMGGFNHRPYNLGWGHHHCNVVVKDAGIQQTLQWMHSVVERNIELGYLSITNKGI